MPASGHLTYSDLDTDEIMPASGPLTNSFLATLERRLCQQLETLHTPIWTMVRSCQYPDTLHTPLCTLMRLSLVSLTLDGSILSPYMFMYVH